MFNICRAANSADKNSLSVTISRQAIHALIIGSTVMFGVTGCGQKGALYLADTSSQTVAMSSDNTNSEVLDSTSNPQDAAFAGIDDDDYQKSRYLEQKQVLPDASDDPNDY
ncbi:putative small lipoprotein YifL [Psychrobacter sp. PL15]|jgi:predicted small lipoprotein YifL|uniref:LptM family lipoprotein n=1 Tax=unclassified Psychrobacter TaxID=196806 RepID=UPI001AE20FA9|nr:lipoprotein [Psychrobacter sp. PL15]MEC5210072.1 putative small lipoprotein YifL [Psychrobacter sp. PL15]